MSARPHSAPAPWPDRAHSRPPYSVIIVLHNSADGLERCLLALPSAAEVIVVDNASTDDGPAIVRRVLPGARLIEEDTNAGFGHACNVGAAHSSSAFLVFVNPDTRVEPNALAILHNAWQLDTADVVGPALTSDGGTLRANCRRRSRLMYDVVELLPAASRWCPPQLRRDLPEHHAVYHSGGVVDYLQGACLGVGRATFDAIGGFDTSFFLYSEEEDLCRRIVRHGGRCRYVPSAVVAHVAHASSSKVPLFSVYHLFRSRAILYRKWSSRRRARIAIAVLYLALRCDRILSTARYRAHHRAVGQSPEWLDHALLGLKAGWAASIDDLSTVDPGTGHVAPIDRGE